MHTDDTSSKINSVWEVESVVDKLGIAREVFDVVSYYVLDKSTGNNFIIASEAYKADCIHSSCIMMEQVVDECKNGNRFVRANFESCYSPDEYTGLKGGK